MVGEDKPEETLRGSKRCLVLGRGQESLSKKRARRVLDVRQHGVWDRNRPWRGD